MQTQSISLNLSAMQSRTSGKSTRVNESTFDRFMSQNASGASRDTRNQNAGKKQELAVKDGQTEVRTGSDEFNRNKISLKSDSQTKDEWLDVADMEEIGAQIVTFLKETFGLSEEDILDIMALLGVSPIEMAFAVSPDTQFITPLNLELMKSFIMEMHGLEDMNLILTSDQLTGEMNELMKGIQDILSAELGAELTDSLMQGDNLMLQSFAEKFSEIINANQETVQTVVDEDANQQIMAQPEMSGAEDEIPVVVEMSGDSGMSGTSADGNQQMPHLTREVQNESPLNAFVERLSQSVNQVTQESVAETGTTMTNIVDQIVKHIRIRVLPQTSSMELQLNPESLGRVNLNVTSQNGTATATLTVQNQVAQEALESQITVLRESLESQGLKVDSVEVNVSEFGFKNPEDSNSRQQQKKTSGRHFRYDAGNEEEVLEETHETDSVVDYTA